MTSTTTESLRAWLVSRVAALRGIEPRTIDARERFSSHGLDSLGAGRLIGELAVLLGRPLSPTLIWEQPTIDALAAHLGGAKERAATAPIEASRPRDVQEPIAIVGMACRFPKAADPAAFWELLAGGVDAITEVPKGRWDAEALFDSDPTAPGRLNTRWGGFLDHVDQFDPQFFGISPREAMQMDPQQRLVLELVWEALEDAGIPPSGLKDSRTGVFIGALFTDYALLKDRAGAEAITTHSSTGGAACIIANRVSYALGLQGPSLTLDTACSSSLVAVHLACQSLRSGESDLVLAGGVNLMLVPETTMGFTKLGAMSPDGSSRAFDAGANGYVRSEGAGVMTLKRLSNALRDGDSIYAFVRGSAVNNDGASNGLTAPNPRAQQAVVREACANAGLAPGDVHYVEAHGTGTPLGDPIEASGLGAVYGSARAADQPLLIGSAKTNIGHLEAAAGVVGLAKVALAMKHDLLPPSLHFETPNPHIDFAGLHLRVATRLQPWPAAEGAPRRAGVSSFGYGGTNSHVILESVPRPVRLLEKRLETPGLHAGGDPRTPDPVGGAGPDAPTGEPRGAVWVFSGQGSQWVGMGRRLVLGERAFCVALERCDRALFPHLGWSVFDELLAGAPRALPDRIDITWPVLFAFQVALAALLRSLGVVPAAVSGHSIGEVAAAHVAGALSIEDAARVIACQARLVQRQVGTGAMLLVALGWEEAEALAVGFGGRVACVISASPVATVLAGEPASIAELGASLAAREVFVRPINSSAAVHGARMAFLADELPTLLTGITPTRAEIPIVSSVTGDFVPGERLDVEYWAGQLCQPVLFAQSTARLLDQRYALFLEVSPHPIVKQSIEESIRHRGLENRAIVAASLLRGEDEARSLREALGLLARYDAPKQGGGADPVRVLPVSGQTESARSASARRLAAFVQSDQGFSLHDLCYTAGVRRPHARARAVLIARGRAELLDGLLALADGREHPSLRTGVAPTGNPPKVTFVFSGQGSQWVGMGQKLFAAEAVFRATIKACDALLRRHVPWSLVEELFAPEEQSRLGETEVVQPALFAVQVGLAALLRSRGVTPDAVIGHSVGELAAAHVAGALSLEEAVRVVALRGRVMQRATGLGKMAWVALTLEDAGRVIAGREAILAIAAVNDPGSVVLSGQGAALDEVVTTLSARGIDCRPLKVNYAFHSPQMDALAQELTGLLGRVEASRTTIPLYSTVTGATIEGEALDAAYWGKNVRERVHFARAVESAFEDGQRLYLEVGPHPVLSTNLSQCLAAHRDEGHVLFTLRRQSDEAMAMLQALGNLYAVGFDVDWKALYPSGGNCVSLPTYPWQRERYWLEPGAAPRGRTAASTPGAHPLLGAPFVAASNPEERCWEQRLSVEDVPYLADHRVQGEVVFPGAGYVEMALAAGAEGYGVSAFVLEELSFDRLLALPAGAARLVQTALAEEGSGRATVAISSRAAGEKEWTRHASGKLRGVAARAETLESLPRIQERCATVMVAAEHYARMEERGLPYGACFQGVERLWLGDGEALGRVRLPEQLAGEEGAYGVHPALLDACIQVTVTLLSRRAGAAPFVPVGAQRARLHGRVPAQAWVHARFADGASGPEGEPVFDLTILDENGRALFELGALRLAPLEAEKTARARDMLDECGYAVAWRKAALPVESRPPLARADQGAWLVVLDQGGAGAALAKRLRARGETCVEAKLGGSYERVDDQRWQIDGTRPADLDRLLAEAFGKRRVCRGVVHCAALDAVPWQETSHETLQADLRRGTVLAVRIAQAILRQGFRDTPQLILVTRGAQAVAQSPAQVSVAQAPLWGLGRTLTLEHAELECKRIDLPIRPLTDEADVLAGELVAGDGEDQIALRAEGRFLARLTRISFDSEEAPAERLEAAAGRPFRLEIREPGVLERLSLHEMERRPPGPGEVEIEVKASGLNFLDVMKAMGIYPGLPPGHVPLGAECAGTVVAVGEGVTELSVGSEVVASTMNSLASHVTVPVAFVAAKSTLLSFEQAATIPVVFMTVYWALHHVARLSRGERILIHSASGGTGLAAIQYARSVGAEIFATAGNEEKRAFLRSLGVEHVMDSRTLAFADEVRARTGERGVDVVLNSLEGEALVKSLEVLAPYGRFLEIGKKDIYQNSRLGLSPFRKCLSYTAIDLAGMATDKPARFAELLREVMARFEDRTFTPLPVQIFGASQAQDAFRRMAQAKHTGKIAIQMNDPEARIAPREVDRGELVSDGSYLITGGLGGLGLSLARWMVSVGARHLVLVGRRAPTDAARKTIRAMEEAGAEVRVVRGDVSLAADVEALVQSVVPPLRGVVHAAGALDDRMLLEMSEEQLWTPIRPKVLGAWNLHAATRGRPLDFFVMYSSVTALLGSPGQGNYVAANAFLDALAHARAAEGLPAMSIQWGPFSEVGMAAAHENRGQRLSHQGMESFTPEEGTDLFSRLLRRPRAEVGVFRLSMRQWLDSHPQASGMRFLTELENEKAQPRSAKAGSFRGTLEQTTAAERPALLEAHVVEQIGRVLRLDPSRIDRRAPFKSLGVDSLMSMELRNRLETSLGLRLPAALLFTYPTSAALADHLLSALAPAPAPRRAPPLPVPAEPAAPPGGDLEHLGGDDLLAMLDEELSLARKNEKAT